MKMQVRCHSCHHWLGETPGPVEFYGVFKDPADRARVGDPRYTFWCGACHWVTVFRAVGSWREVSLKTG